MRLFRQWVHGIIVQYPRIEEPEQKVYMVVRLML